MIVIFKISRLASKQARKPSRIVIPQDISAFPGFPTDMGKFESATSYGEAVIRFWHDWRKVKSKDKKKAKREKIRSEKANSTGNYIIR